MKKITLIFVFAVLFSISIYKAEALSFECSLCTNEPSYVGVQVVQVLGSEISSVGPEPAVAYLDSPYLYAFEYSTDDDFEVDNNFAQAYMSGAYTTAWYGSSYISKSFLANLKNLDSDTTFYYRINKYSSGTQMEDLEEGTEDPIFSGEVKSFKTKQSSHFTVKMYKGMSYNSEVERMQELLFNFGYYTVSYDYSLTKIADGKFGAMTDTAVKAFQSSYGLTADGIVGPDTRGKLNFIVDMEQGGCSATLVIPPVFACPAL
jgi:peptidoglycan hydrolase-like protein with peptidoglycan-binding domain